MLLKCIYKLSIVCANLSFLNMSFIAALGSAQSRLLPQGRRFAELARQNSEIDVSD